MLQPSNVLGKKIADRYSALEALRKPWEALWQEIATYIMPRRSPGMGGTIGAPSTAAAAALFDSHAVQANMTLANGQLAWMSPLESQWFAFDASDLEDDGAKRWLANATRKAAKALAVSNFYTAIHEFYLDRGAFGTACLYVELTTKGNLSTQCWPVGTFVVDEDAEGTVDTVIRTFSLSARQAVQKFGEANVSEKIRKAASEAKTQHGKHEFLHAIYPRDAAERDAGKRDAQNMAIASVYTERDGGHVCRVGGHEEMPVFVSRYLEWGSGLGSNYGWSPSFVALPDARQLNFLQQWCDAMAEKMADPPWLAPDDLEGEIDVNAHGVTYFSRELAAANALPRPLGSEAGRMEPLLERIRARQDSIDRAFHVDLFAMFSQVTKQMTAREVSARESEKLIQFSPTFSRLVSDLFNPLLARVFALLLRCGKLGPIGDVPKALLTPISDTEAELETPAVEYASRMALSLRALPAQGYMRTLERLAAVAGMVPYVLDNYDFDKAERSVSLTDGVPNDFLRPIEQVDELRAARAEAQQAAQAQAAQAQQAEIAAKVGGIPGDSPVGKQIAQQVQSQAA